MMNIGKYQTSGFFMLVYIVVTGVIVACTPVAAQPSGQTAPGATEPRVAPATPSSTDAGEKPTAAPSTAMSEAPAAPPSTATSEALIPAGWATHTSQECGFAINYPSEMQVIHGDEYSQFLEFKLPDPEEGARNFVYVSKIVQDVQALREEGIYIYNYDPAEAELLRSMQVDESKSLREGTDLAPWFSYQRKPDTQISGYAGQTYENVQPWEFPSGTKEIRYYVSLGECTYQIGGYMDTTNSNQPGAITEELFNQIVATIRLVP